MKHGEFLQVDTPIKVYDYPAAHFVGGFIGNPPMNFLDARFMGDNGSVLVSGLRLPIAPPVAARLKEAGHHQVWLGIRAENIEPLEQRAEGALVARVLVVEPLGSHNLLTVKVGDAIVKVNAHPDRAFRAEQDIWLRLSADKMRWLDKDTGQALFTGEEGAGPGTGA
jgi:multiple sugar transport system ATP-binding protein